eukprot:CAMPEP_0170619760 /NCGR_PEP_ID=MMETSP0224-20130122/27688_1 /TAXON_ID=285029 /ORGANISM="Togula jolla, Strain CCCM 725" /LENGTH=362 /DNA_ID=CAMNT_0010945871 /DNA_START=61 /DNA_END=1152 /DNA_ORIENTATION=+
MRLLVLLPLALGGPHAKVLELGLVYAPTNASHGPAPHDAVPLKSWASLKQSTAKIGNEVQELQEVNNDIGMMQEDLTSQEGLWHQAETELKEENQKLAAEAFALKQELCLNQSLKAEVAAMREDYEGRQRHTDEVQQSLAHEEKLRQLERDFLTQRARSLKVSLLDLNASADNQVKHSREEQLQLQTDSMAMRDKAEELKESLRAAEAELERQQKEDAGKTLELQQRIAELRKSFDSIAAHLNDGTQGALEEVKERLREVVAAKWEARQQQVQFVAKCESMKRQRHEALRASEEKARKRQEESRQFCGPVIGQNAALKRQLAECLTPAAVAEDVASAAPAPAPGPVLRGGVRVGQWLDEIGN